MSIEEGNEIIAAHTKLAIELAETDDKLKEDLKKSGIL